MTGYRVLRLMIRAATAVFFRRVEVVGLENVPEGGPVIFAGNHPNALVDPAVLVVSTRRVVRFAAKDALFRIPLMNFVLRQMGAVPIARRSEHPDGPLDNRASLESLVAALVSGSAVGIFPEGISHDDSQVQRLKTGAARIAFAAAASLRKGIVRIVPCGLHYVHRKRFRSRVLVQFGPAIEISAERLEAFRHDEREAVRALTAEVEEGLRALTVNADDWETVRVLDGARRLLQRGRLPLEERVEIARLFNRVYPGVRHDPEVERVYGEVRDYLDRLHDAGLADSDLDRGVTKGERAGKIARHLLLMLVWVPLAIPGFVLHAPVGVLVVSAARLLTPRKDVMATSKLASGILGCLLVYLAVLAGVFLAFGWVWMLVALAAIPVTAYADLVVIDRGASVRKHTATLLRLGSLGEEVEDLRTERDRLARQVAGVVKRLRGIDLSSRPSGRYSG
jgi:1-acyl-sn-glycerol-3-phosphate acyltransferase